MNNEGDMETYVSNSLHTLLWSEEHFRDTFTIQIESWESCNILGQMRKINVTIHKKIFNSKFSPIVKIGSFIEIIGAN